MVGREFGPFRIERLIAVGGMAEVYLAKAGGVGGFEKRLALKVIRPHFAEDEHFIQMLVEEAKIAVQLNHSNIVHVFDLGRIEGAYYLTMEYVDGPDLFRVLKKASQLGLDLPIELAVYLAAQVCAGLDYAHRKADAQGRPLGLVHRDVSPQNVLISQAGEVKLVDFGIAKAVLRAGQTRAGVIKGKYYYMSPEQAWGDPVDHRSDIFSAGVLLYETLAGGMLYIEEDIEKLIGLVRRADIPPVRTRRPDCPPPLERIVMKALARNPEDRYPSGRYFEAALVRFLASFAADFGPGRLGQMVREIGFAEEQPAPPAPPAGGATDRLTREALEPILAHSVIAGPGGGLPAEDDEPTVALAREHIEDMRPLPPESQPTAAGLDPTVVSGPPDFAGLVRAAAGPRSLPEELEAATGFDEPEETDDLVRAFGRGGPGRAAVAPLPGLVPRHGEVVSGALPEAPARFGPAKIVGLGSRRRTGAAPAVSPPPSAAPAVSPPPSGAPAVSPPPSAAPAVSPPLTIRRATPRPAAAASRRLPAPPVHGAAPPWPADARADIELLRWEAAQRRRRVKAIAISVTLALAAVAAVAWFALAPASTWPH